MSETMKEVIVYLEERCEGITCRHLSNCKIVHRNKFGTFMPEVGVELGKYGWYEVVCNSRIECKTSLYVCRGRCFDTEDYCEEVIK